MPRPRYRRSCRLVHLGVTLDIPETLIRDRYECRRLLRYRTRRLKPFQDDGERDATGSRLIPSAPCGTPGGGPCLGIRTSDEHSPGPCCALGRTRRIIRAVLVKLRGLGLWKPGYEIRYPWGYCAGNRHGGCGRRWAQPLSFGPMEGDRGGGFVLRVQDDCEDLRRACLDKAPWTSGARAIAGAPGAVPRCSGPLRAVAEGLPAGGCTRAEA